MIICQCAGISDHDIRAAVDWMRRADPDTIITPGKIYHALGKRADCGGCMPLFLATMRGCDAFKVPMNLRGLKLVALPTEEPKPVGQHFDRALPDDFLAILGHFLEDREHQVLAAQSRCAFDAKFLGHFDQFGGSRLLEFFPMHRKFDSSLS